MDTDKVDTTAEDRVHVMKWQPHQMADGFKYQVPGLDLTNLGIVEQCTHCRAEKATALDNFSKPICDRCSKIEASKQIKRKQMPRRNDMCPCGSNLKYKRCCMRNG